MLPFTGQNIAEDQKKKKKKRSSLQNELVFSPKVCDDQKKKKKVFAYQSVQSVGFWSQKNKKRQMVSPQNGYTRGGPPPPSDATATDIK